MAVMKVWNGSSWVYPFFLYPKIWNGSDWVTANPKVWNGSEWVDRVAPPFLDKQTITTGNQLQYPSYGSPYYLWGYLSGSFGSINPTASAIYPGATVYGAEFDESSSVLYLILTGGTVTNTGWDRIVINGNTFFRTSGYFYQFGSFTYWFFNGATNPFTTVGAQVDMFWY